MYPVSSRRDGTDANAARRHHRPLGYGRAMARQGTWGLIVRVARSPELRRVQLAYAGYSISENATWLAMLFYALQRGGVREVGLVAFVQLLPTVLLTPFSAYAGDRFPPCKALSVGYAVQSLAMAAAAAAMWADGGVSVYVAGAVMAAAISFTRPVMGSLLPQLTHSPKDLVAANVGLGLIEQLGVFVGPLAAGIVMALASPASVFALGAVLTAVGCLAVLLTVSDDDMEMDKPGTAEVLHRMFAGFGALAQVPRVRMLVTMVAIAGLAKGVGDVAFVTFADERLSGGGDEAGVLAGAYGVGAMAGAAAVTRMVRTGGTSGQCVFSAVLIAVGLFGMAAASMLAPALFVFALSGAGACMLQLTASVTIQREAPSELLARIFGIVEGAQIACLAIGSLLVTWLATTLSLGDAFIILAVVLGPLVLVAVWRLRRHGDDLEPVDERIVDRLLLDPLFAPMAAPQIDRLARNATARAVAAGTAVITQGAEGDEFYLVMEGQFSVHVDGRLVATASACDSFGELALLRGAPRSATVTATSPATLLVVNRNDFLETVTGHPRSVRAADAAADGYVF